MIAMVAHDARIVVPLRGRRERRETGRSRLAERGCSRRTPRPRHGHASRAAQRRAGCSRAWRDPHEIRLSLPRADLACRRHRHWPDQAGDGARGRHVRHSRLLPAISKRRCATCAWRSIAAVAAAPASVSTNAGFSRGRPAPATAARSCVSQASEVEMNWPHKSSIDELNEFYGDPRGGHNGASPNWQAQNLVQLVPPYDMKFSWGPKVEHLLFHRKCRDAFGEALLAIRKLYGARPNRGDRMHLTGGSFMFRLMRGSSSKLSIDRGGRPSISIRSTIRSRRNGVPASFRRSGERFQKCGLIWRGANGDDDRCTSRPSNIRIAHDRAHRRRGPSRSLRLRLHLVRRGLRGLPRRARPRDRSARALIPRPPGPRAIRRT